MTWPSRCLILNLGCGNEVVFPKMHLNINMLGLGHAFNSDSSGGHR